MSRQHSTMRFDDRFLEELKARLRLSDVIGRTVKLRRRGREFVGLSPFQTEKTPSFTVNDDKGFFHDFSSGKHGDIIAFVQETERLSFTEAVERLAHQAGMALPSPDPPAAERERRRAVLGGWLEQAATWFEAQLRLPVGQPARAYLTGRALPEDQWARFRLGFAPSGRTALLDYLVAKGAVPAELVEAGLLIAPGSGGAPYDRFRARVMFPITDARGRLVSFGGRALDPAAGAKYLNGPQTALFDKGQGLYGLAEARKILAAPAPAPGPALVVVEGYLDVIACQRTGLAAVAPLGTALTEDQMDLLWRHHPEPTLCFDGDRAGRQAASRIIDRALPRLKPGRSFTFVQIEGGKDPDELLRELGAAALKAELSRTTPFVDVLFARERDLEPLDTPERRAGLKQRLRAAAARITDPDLAQAYRDALFPQLEALFPRPLFMPRGPSRPAGVSDPAGLGRARDHIAQRIKPFHAAVALAALDHPAWARPYAEALERIGFGDARLEPLVVGVIEALVDADDAITVRAWLSNQGQGALLAEVARAAAVVGAPFLDPTTRPDRARAQWTACFEALIALGDAERALEALRHVPVTADTLATARGLRGQVISLQRRISALDFW